ISATGPAISVAPPRGQPQIESIVFEVIHGVVLEQPVECGAIVKLDAHHEVGPEGRAIRIGTAGVVAYEAESPAAVGRRGLVVTGEEGRVAEGAGGGGGGSVTADCCTG